MTLILKGNLHIIYIDLALDRDVYNTTGLSHSSLSVCYTSTVLAPAGLNKSN